MEKPEQLGEVQVDRNSGPAPALAANSQQQRAREACRLTSRSSSPS